MTKIWLKIYLISLKITARLYLRPKTETFIERIHIQRRIQDFPGGGAPTYDFAKFSRKLHEIERIWAPRGGARPLRPPPPKSATDIVDMMEGVIAQTTRMKQNVVILLRATHVSDGSRISPRGA